MQRTRRTWWIAAVVLAFAGSSFAGPKPIVKETKTPASLAEPRIDSAQVPPQCRQFLHISRDTTSELYPWLQRLSVAACREEVTLPVVSKPSQIVPMLTTLRDAMAPSIASYRDALARGPQQIRMLAAWGLGRTYVDMIVRARSAIHVDDDTMAAYGGVGYGGHTYMSRGIAMHLALEILLAPEHQGAHAAFADVAQIAEENPLLARANLLMPIVITHARLEDRDLR